jgi:hypothetical protein
MTISLKKRKEGTLFAWSGVFGSCEQFVKGCIIQVGHTRQVQLLEDKKIYLFPVYTLARIR